MENLSLILSLSLSLPPVLPFIKFHSFLPSVMFSLHLSPLSPSLLSLLTWATT